jgi:hypothetical protein
MVFRYPPELAVATGLVCLGFAYFNKAWPMAAMGAICTLIGVYDLWRGRRRPE